MIEYLVVVEGEQVLQQQLPIPRLADAGELRREGCLHRSRWLHAQLCHEG